MTTLDQVHALRVQGGIIWENERYGAVYVIDHPELHRMINDGVIPVVHLGQTAAVEALTAVTSLSWLVISLECPRPVAVARIQERATGDTRARLSAWDHTAPLTAPDLAVNTLLLSARSSSTHPRRA